MSTTVASAVQQVYQKLGEAADSVIADLPSGTGAATSPDIASDDQIITWLTWASRELVRLGVLTLYGKGSVSPAAGTIKAAYSSLTMATTGQVFWLPLSASWNAVAVDVCDRRWYEVHNRSVAADSYADVERVYPEEDGVLLAPRPSAARSLVLEGLVYPRALASGGSCDDIPDQLVPLCVTRAAQIAAQRQRQDTYDAMAVALGKELDAQIAVILKQGRGEA